MKQVFTPLSIIIGLLAGKVASSIADKIWSAFDDEEAPEPKFREISMVKLVPALLLQGAVFKLVKGLVDHALRHGFTRLTGEWPGEERPEPE